MIDTRSVEPRQRFDFWASSFSGTPAPVTIERAEQTTFSGLAKVYAGGSLTLFEIRNSAIDVHRRMEDISRGAEDLAYVILVNRGSFLVRQNERGLACLPGDIVVGYDDSPFLMQMREASEVTMIKVPADKVRHGARNRCPTLISGRLSPYAFLAASYMRSLPRDAKALQAGGAFFVKQLLALVTRASRDDLHPMPGKRSLYEAIQQAIEAEVANPDLSVRSLCTRLGVSRSTLYEAAATEGRTVAGMVLERRLTGCQEDLRRAGPGTTVATISERWGFRDQSSFNRAFRRRFGMIPTDWKGA